MQFLKLAVAAVALGASASPGGAATIVLNQDVDLRYATVFPTNTTTGPHTTMRADTVRRSGNPAAEIVNQPITMKAGDTLVWTLNFGAQVVRLSDLLSMFMTLTEAPGNPGYRSDGYVLEMLGVGGAPIHTFSMFAWGETNWSPGGTYRADLLPGATLPPQSMDLNGVRVTYKLNSMTNAQNVTLDRSALNITARTLSIQSAIPEPASWAMLVVGFALVGAMLRGSPPSRRLRVRYA